MLALLTKLIPGSSFFSAIFGPLGAMVGGALAILIVIGVSHHEGYAEAASKCQAAALQSELLATKADANAARSAAAEAERGKSALEAENAANLRKVHDYASALAKAPARPVCDLSDSDARRLRGIAPSGRRRAARKNSAP